MTVNGSLSDLSALCAIWEICILIRLRHWVILTSQKITLSDSVPSDVYVQSISDGMGTLRRNVEIGFFYMLWKTLNFQKWPWETLVHKPLSQETLMLSTTSISDERFRRYELEWTDTTATFMLPPNFFFRKHKIGWQCMHIYTLWSFFVLSFIKIPTRF
jgi:hypothetical protein